MRSLHTPTKSSPKSQQLEEAGSQLEDQVQPKNLKIKKEESQKRLDIVKSWNKMID